MADRYLKHTPSGQIYIWQGVFAAREDFVECADVLGTPMPDALEGEFTVVEEETKPKATRKKRAVVEEPVSEVEAELDAEDEFLDSVLADAALSADASTGL